MEAVVKHDIVGLDVTVDDLRFDGVEIVESISCFNGNVHPYIPRMSSQIRKGVIENQNVISTEISAWKQIEEFWKETLDILTPGQILCAIQGFHSPESCCPEFLGPRPAVQTFVADVRRLLHSERTKEGREEGEDQRSKGRKQGTKEEKEEMRAREI
ncbi:hypothetical protein M5K25_015897 [Dendrobium thyrsiflorum]|uniref:Uncharacterized protein n=1 Tax=Dendrobium thyrsiflorum TaxID=117978 RepID=A0ABD0UYE8_DENTH